MRRYATFFLIAVMSLGLLFLLLTRSRTPHDAPAEIVEIKEAADAGDAGADAGALVVGADAAGDAGAAPPPKPAERPLRVTALGWELVAAGVGLTAADGGAMSPGVELAPEVTLEAVEARLARGGSDPVGADVAILPLPAFVVAYERLRALEPRAFMIVGFSRGREEVHAATGALLKAPPGGDEVKLIAFGPATAGEATAKAAGTESATVLGLFALDLLGVAPARVRFVAPAAADAKSALFSAIARGAADDRKLALSTADAARLVPIVAVAPKALLDASEPKMRELARAWLEGLGRAGKDASSVARRLANKEALPLGAGVGGAPEAIALLERLGQVEAATLAQQSSYFGASAKGPVTLATLTQRTWSLARAAGLTTNAAPEALPIDARIVTALAPSGAAPPRATDGDAGGADAGTGAFAPLPTGATPLVLYRAVEAQADAASVAAQIGFLAAIFEHAAFRVTAKGGEKAARVIANAARERFDLPAARLATGTGEPAGAFAAVEILALP
jgi:hypothetical protein